MGNPHFSPVATPIQQAFLVTGDSLTALAERTAQVDRVITESAAALLFPAAPAGLALLAVGGYGRRQLFPYSEPRVWTGLRDVTGGGKPQQQVSECISAEPIGVERERAEIVGAAEAFEILITHASPRCASTLRKLALANKP